jgi:hypothetical protein
LITKDFDFKKLVPKSPKKINKDKFRQYLKTQLIGVFNYFISEIETIDKIHDNYD